MFEPNEFEWDAAKAASNLRKHGVSFIAGARVFLDPGRVEWDVSRPIDFENRWKAVGFTDGKLLAVVFTIREGKCRLISARPVNAAEERIYGNRSLHP